MRPVDYKIPTRAERREGQTMGDAFPRGSYVKASVYGEISTYLGNSMELRTSNGPMLLPIGGAVTVEHAERPECFEVNDVVQDADGDVFQRVKNEDGRLVWRAFDGWLFPDDFPERPLTKMEPRK